MSIDKPPHISLFDPVAPQSLAAKYMGVGQGLALSPVLLALYLAPGIKLYLASNIGQEVDVISYVNYGTIIARSRRLEDNLLLLQQAYEYIHSAFSALGLVLEHDKSEVFHFSRVRNSPPLRAYSRSHPVVLEQPRGN